MKEQAIWQGVLGELELTISSSAFSAWFKKTKLQLISDDKAIIIAPNIFVRAQLEKKFDTQIHNLLKSNGFTGSISYKTESKNRKSSIDRNQPVDDAKSQTEKKRNIIAPSQKNASNLNPRYTFDNFIVGSSNDLAYAACQAVSTSPGVKYNPLYLYGSSGLGKTHLMQAVGNEVLKQQPSARVLYTTTEAFVNEFLEYIRFKKKGFSDKYRNVDVLIVDDMQFIAGKEKTQDEFFHTFNDLYQNNKQIIISSDKPPKSIPTLTDRLRSRFEWGMAIDVQMPDYETRCAIVTAKSQLSDITLDNDVVEYLAANFKTNIRELEGALNRLLAYTEMQGFIPDVAAAEGLLGDMKRIRPQHITPKQIIDKTARYFNLDPKDICSPRRDKFIVLPRQISMYLLRSELKLSFPRIAQELGRKDHTTAMHSIEKITKETLTSPVIREQINDIRDKLYVQNQ